MNALAFKLLNPFSDHYPLILTLNKIAIERQDNISKNVISYNKLRNNARLMEWSNILSIRDPNSAIDALISKIGDCLNNATVSKTREKSYRNMIPRKNWITPAIITTHLTKSSKSFYSAVVGVQLRQTVWAWPEVQLSQIGVEGGSV